MKQEYKMTDDKKRLIARALKAEKREAGAKPMTDKDIPLTDVELDSKLRRNKNERIKAIWGYLEHRAWFLILAEELDCIKDTIDNDFKDIDTKETDSDKKPITFLRNTDGVRVSKKLLQAKLNQSYISYKKTYMNNVRLLEELRKDWNVTGEEIVKKHKEWVLNHKHNKE